MFESVLRRLPPHLPGRVRREIKALYRQSNTIVFYLFVFIYLSTVLFRNLAFYRYRASPRLRDLGYDILPDWEHNEVLTAAEDVPMILCNGSMVVAALMAMWGNSKMLGVNMLIRVLAVLCIGHTLRFFTYMSTTLPGTQENCLPGHLQNMHPPQPTTFGEVFTRIAANPGNNCGDLMFSGHILGILTPTLMVHRFGPGAIVETGLLSQGLLSAWLCVLYACVIAQGFIIVTLRNHYTADIVVSGYVCPLLWNWCVVLVHEHHACARARTHTHTHALTPVAWHARTGTMAS